MFVHEIVLMLKDGAPTIVGIFFNAGSTQVYTVKSVEKVLMAIAFCAQMTKNIF